MSTWVKFALEKHTDLRSVLWTCVAAKEVTFSSGDEAMPLTSCALILQQRPSNNARADTMTLRGEINEGML